MILRTKKTSFFVTVNGSRIEVCPLTTSEQLVLREKYTSIKDDKEIIDGQSLTKELFNQVVIGWDETICDDGGQLPCDTVTKNGLYENENWFVDAVLKEMHIAELARKEALLKN